MIFHLQQLLVTKIRFLWHFDTRIIVNSNVALALHLLLPGAAFLTFDLCILSVIILGDSAGLRLPSTIYFEFVFAVSIRFFAFL